jgi:hypothetical protein
MSRTRDISKVLSSNTDLVTTEELNSALSNVTVDLSGYLTISSASTTYLTNSSASTTYATQASLATIDSDNNPDIYLNMGG